MDAATQELVERNQEINTLSVSLKESNQQLRKFAVAEARRSLMTRDSAEELSEGNTVASTETPTFQGLKSLPGLREIDFTDQKNPLGDDGWADSDSEEDELEESLSLSPASPSSLLLCHKPFSMV